MAVSFSIEDVVAKATKDPSFGLLLTMALPAILSPWTEETVEVEQEGRKKSKKVQMFSRVSPLDDSALVVAYDDEETGSWTWEFIDADADADEDDDEEIPGGDGYASPQAAMEAADAWAKAEELLLAPGKPEDYETDDGS